MEMTLRVASIKDLDEIMVIIDQAAGLLRKSGSPQWSSQDKPTKAEFEERIRDNLTYVLVLNQKIIGTTTLSFKEEAGYDTIKYGQWQDSQKAYASIHRFAVAPSVRGKGYAKLFLEMITKLLIEQGCCDIRIDTHPKNIAMQKNITKTNFLFRGVIDLPVEHGERYAYQYQPSNIN